MFLNLWGIQGAECEYCSGDCSVSNDSGNLAAITTLAAIGILTGNDELVQASLSDLMSAPPEKRRILDPTGDVDRLLVLNALHSVGNPPTPYNHAINLIEIVLTRVTQVKHMTYFCRLCRVTHRQNAADLTLRSTSSKSEMSPHHAKFYTRQEIESTPIISR